MVPEPKPTEPGARTRMRTTVSHGLGFLKTGSSAASVVAFGRGLGVLSVLAFAAGIAIVIGLVGLIVVIVSPSAWARVAGTTRRVGPGLGLGLGIQVELGELSGRLASRGSAQFVARRHRPR